MSTTFYAYYYPRGREISHEGEHAIRVSLTSFYGGEYGRSIQITVGNSYVAMTEAEAKDFAKQLRRWAKGKWITEVNE